MRYNHRKHLDNYKATGKTPVAYFPLREFIKKYANANEPALSIGCSLGFECISMYKAGRSYILGLDKNIGDVRDAIQHPMIEIKHCNITERFSKLDTLFTDSKHKFTLAVLRHMDKQLDTFTTKYLASMLHYHNVTNIIIEVLPSKFGTYNRAALLFAEIRYNLYYKAIIKEDNFMLLERLP